MDIPQHVFLRHVTNRWLTLYYSLSRFIEQFPALKVFFQKQSNPRDTGRLQRICKALLQDKTLYAKALFLRNASELFTGFLTLFQKNEPLIHVLYDEMVELVKKILGRFLKVSCFQGLAGAEFSSLDLDNSENYRKKPEVGVDTSKELQDWNETEKRKFFVGVRSFYISCCSYLIKVLPFGNKVLEKMKCLHPLFRYEDTSMMCIRQLAASVPSVIPASSISKVTDEWTVYQSGPSSSTATVEYGRIDEYWAKIFSEKNSSGNSKYPNLSVVVKALLHLAHGNADCERAFSENKHMLQSRWSLCLPSINGIRRIKSYVKHAGSVENVVITPSLISKVKNSWRAYEARTEAEKNRAIHKQKQQDGEDIDALTVLKNEEVVLRKNLESSQLMLSKAQATIQSGLTKKCFVDVECGNLLLKESSEKIAKILSKIKQNETEQLKLKTGAQLKKKKTA